MQLQGEQPAASFFQPCFDGPVLVSSGTVHVPGQKDREGFSHHDNRQFLSAFDGERIGRSRYLWRYTRAGAILFFYAVFHLRNAKMALARP